VVILNKESLAPIEAAGGELNISVEIEAPEHKELEGPPETLRLSVG